MNERKRLRKLAGLNEEILLEIKQKSIIRMQADLGKLLKTLDALNKGTVDIAVKTNMVRAKEAMEKAMAMLKKAEKDAPR